MLAATLEGADVKCPAHDDGQDARQTQERDRRTGIHSWRQSDADLRRNFDLTGKIKVGELVNFVAQQVGGRAVVGRTWRRRADDPDKLPAAMASVQAWVETETVAIGMPLNQAAASDLSRWPFFLLHRAAGQERGE